MWAYGRVVAGLAVQVAGVMTITWLLVEAVPQAAAAPARGFAGPPPPITIEGLAADIAPLALRSLELLVLAVLWGTAAGALAAVAVVASRRRVVTALLPATSAVWAVPTFIIAVAVQWLQARAYQATGTSVSGIYGEAGPLNILWAAAVLGLRPAVYGFRQTHLALEEEAEQPHVRAAVGRGLAWPAVVRRHVLRPAAAAVLAAWLNSFRLMVGVLPLVEFFFGYPGAGRRLVLAIGLREDGSRAPLQPDLAIGLVATMAFLLLAVEAAVRLWRLRLDPRLRLDEVAA
jgi:peptide/nickel transport system permease protein